MRNSRREKIWIKITAYLMAVGVIFSQSMVGMAAGDKPQMQEEDARSMKEAAEQETDGTEDKEDDKNTEETIGEKVPAQIEDLETAQEDLGDITEQKSILALVYLCDKYGVKESPSIDSSTVVSVVCGQSVQILGVDLDDEGSVWYKVSLYQQDKNYQGYIEKQYLATSDEDFLEWTDEYVDEEEVLVNKPKTLSIMAISDYPDVNQFPASYQNSLLALKQKYPNWIFVKMETGLNFNTAVASELGDKSWISNTKPASWQNGAAKQSGWSYASEGILRYYMDPRNFLTESAIFQFEQLTYNESYHTEAAVQAIVAGSFMAGDIPGENMTYAQAFTQIGKELKISPFHLASRVLQEQGTKGTSPLISGTYSGYEGYYNYFNVGASGKDIELIVKGLTEAMNRGWNTRYKSLYGGASVIGQNYILRGQDTLYLQKFNVSSNSTYNHQYMQNIQAPASEAPSIQKAYRDTGSLNNSFVFKIPVYSNMPASACAQPDTTDKITLSKSTINGLAVDKTEKLVPYVNGSKPDNVNDMSFTSNNTSVATVDAQGVIKAVSPGTATITCARSGASGATCTVTVVKAEPTVDTPVLPPVVYKDGLKLSDISLPEGWAWSDGNTRLMAGTDSYPAVYTPADTTRYLTVTKQIGIKVSQAIPSCTVPENLTAKLGSRLGSIALPDGFIWESDAETILDKAGEQTFYLSYYPSDINYFELLHIPVIVKVIGDNTKPEEPDDQGGTLPGGDGGSGNTGGSNGNGSNAGNGGSSTGSGNAGSSGNVGNAGNESETSGSGNNGGQNNGGTTSSGSTSNSGGTGNSGSADKNDNAGSSAPVDSGSINTSKDNTSKGSTTNDNGSSNTSNNTTNDNGSSNTSNSTTANNSSGNTNNDSATGNNDGGNTNISSGSTDNNSTLINNGGIKNNTTTAQSKNTYDIPVGSNQDTVSASDDPVAEESEDKPVYARPSVTVDMEDVPILTDEMLQMAKDQNVDLLLKMNDKAMWYVSADAVKGNFADTDMNVLFGKGIIPQDLLEKFGEEIGYQEFTLAHDGPFGFVAELEVLLNPEYCGQYANLFYFDAEADRLEFICAEVIDENGYVRFPMDHASSYVIIISDHILTEIPGENETSSSPLRWVIIGLLILIALTAIGTTGYFYLRKRREEEELLDEDDWIEDEDWQEPEKAEEEDPYAADHAEDDWIEDDEWDISNDWMDDAEWEKKQELKKTAV